MMVGEQPGDAEDLAGHPFVGPAGKMLDRAMADAGLVRKEIYLTNAVKHFKWVPRGKRRMHDTPNAREVAACHPWLIVELAAVEPEVIVCLGRTAIAAVMGKPMKVLENRGKLLETDNGLVLITIHPSMLLRLPSSEERQAAFAAFVADLKKIPKRQKLETRKKP
jgi:uracil-DNA glycosylase family protein